MLPYLDYRYKGRTCKRQKGYFKPFYNNFLLFEDGRRTTVLTYVFKVVINAKYVVFELEFVLEFLF